MFEFLFRYPIPVFTKGRYVLLGTWPAWLLPILILAFAVASAALVRWRFGDIGPTLRNWRVWALWSVRLLFVALLLTLLWQPAITIAELNSNQNMIAVVVDDSRSMAIADSGGKTREADALDSLRNGLLAALGKRFQTRVYRLSGLTRVASLEAIAPVAAATHIGDGLQKLTTDTADLPVGAVLLLTDGAENTASAGGTGISPEALESLRNRRLPVHTVGFGAEQLNHDVEIEDVSLAASAVANARIAASVSLTQHGYTGQTVELTVRDGDRILAVHPVTLAGNGVLQTEPLFFSAGAAGAKNLRIGLEPLPGEENRLNNMVSRPILISDAKRRILYVEGEPRWEFKFIRRAEEQDVTVDLVSMLRTSENKIYRQGISGPEELAGGFPVRAEELFGYAGIIIGSVAADYFTPLQQELLREYVDRRGGGILFLGGRSSMSDGGWGVSSLSELLPTSLPSGRDSFHRNPATVSLTPRGADSPLTRLLDDPAKNVERWRKLTYLADYQDAGTPKPGATVLAEINAGRRKLPLLITQSYGHGRTAILATGGTWRWQMSEALGDPSHDLFWQQLLRWLVAESPGPVVASMPQRLLMDEGHVQIAAQVRDQDFQPAANARVTAHLVGPGGASAVVDLRPSQESVGTYRADWTVEKPGAYLAEITAVGAAERGPELGRDVVTFAREDGIAENFHTPQNRRLLEQISAQTGGRYWKTSDLKDLARDISYSEAGLSLRTTKELWDMPIVFLLLLLLPIAEWLLRRRWGVV